MIFRQAILGIRDQLKPPRRQVRASITLFSMCWSHRGDHRILALRHKILLLMIEGLARRGGAEVSPRARDDALIRKRTSAATSTDLRSNLSTFYLHLPLPCMSG
jgi:hypothetical protein